MVVFLGVLVFVLLATAKRSRQPAPGFEAAAIGRVRAVISAQRTHLSVCGSYADSLERLVRPSCKPDIRPESFLSADIVSTQERFRYYFELIPSADSESHYAYIAVPNEAAIGSMRAFCGDDSGRIYVDSTGTRPAVRGGQCADRSSPIP
jgi:hypothetical protein